MSVAITYKGNNCCVPLAFSLRRVLGPGADGGDPTVVELAHAMSVDPDDPRALTAECRKRASGVSALKLFPSVVPVVAGASGGSLPGFTDDLDITLAVLTHSSDVVFIRRRSPVVTPAKLVRPITLIFPVDWSFS